MKIGFDGRYAEGDLVGVGKYIKNLASELDSRGVECYIFYSKESKYKIKGNNIKSIVLPKTNRIIFEQFLLPMFFKKYKIDLYHAPGNTGIPFCSNVKSVLTVHDLIPLQYKNYFNYSKIPFLSKVLYTLRLNNALKLADKIVSVSKFTKKGLVAKGVVSDKVSVIYSGTNIFPKKITNKNIYGEYIINNGGLDIRKNTDGLIKSFALVHRKLPNLKLVITGENLRYKEELLKLVKRLNIGDFVIFTGYVDESEMAGLIKNAKCLCYPSIIEGFGFPVLEAFLLGTPVVASNTSSIPEIAENAAVLVDPKNIEEISDGIVKVLTNTNLSKRLVESGYEQIKKYSWKKATNEYLDLYSRILK